MASPSEFLPGINTTWSIMNLKSASVWVLEENGFPSHGYPSSAFDVPLEELMNQPILKLVELTSKRFGLALLFLMSAMILKLILIMLPILKGVLLVVT